MVIDTGVTFILTFFTKASKITTINKTMLHVLCFQTDHLLGPNIYIYDILGKCPFFIKITQLNNTLLLFKTELQRQLSYWVI